MGSFVSDFFHLVECLQGSPVLSYVSVLYTEYDQIPFNCMYVLYFVYPFISGWTLGSFHLLALLNFAEHFSFNNNKMNVWTKCSLSSLPLPIMVL